MKNTLSLFHDGISLSSYLTIKNAWMQSFFKSLLQSQYKHGYISNLDFNSLCMSFMHLVQYWHSQSILIYPLLLSVMV